MPSQIISLYINTQVSITFLHPKREKKKKNRVHWPQKGNSSYLEPRDRCHCGIAKEAPLAV